MDTFYSCNFILQFGKFLNSMNFYRLWIAPLSYIYLDNPFSLSTATFPSENPAFLHFPNTIFYSV